MALGHYSHAARCYREQLERAQELQDCALEAQAYGNLGIAKLNMGHYEDAIGYLEQVQPLILTLGSCKSHKKEDDSNLQLHMESDYQSTNIH